jgi:hypothetical protein
MGEAVPHAPAGTGRCAMTDVASPPGRVYFASVARRCAATSERKRCTDASAIR